MELINFLLKRPILIYLIVLTAIILIFSITKKIIEKYFSNKMYWFLQNTVFLTPKALLAFIYIVFLALLINGVYSFYQNFWFGIIYASVLFYFIFKIIRAKKNGNFNFNEEFEFHRHSTDIKYYKTKNIKYKERTYRSIIAKIEKIYVGNKFNSNGFLIAFNKILTFDNFNYWIENNESSKSLGQLFYWKYKLSLFNTIDNIKKYNCSDTLIENTLSNYQMLDFDDKKGLHYNTEKVIEYVQNLTTYNTSELFKKYRNALEIKTDTKTAINFFNKYIELEFSNNSNLKQRFKQMVYFCKGELDALPQFEDTKLIKTEDLKRIIAMYYQFNNRKENTYNIFNYKLPEMIYLVLYFFNTMDEKENQSLPKAHSSKEWELSNTTRKELNSILEKSKKID